METTQIKNIQNMRKQFQTRMHSSRIRTVRNSSRLPGGVPAWGGVLAWGVSTCLGGLPAQGVPAQGCTCRGGVPAGGCTCQGGTCLGAPAPMGCTCLGVPAPGAPTRGHLLREVPALGGAGTCLGTPPCEQND